MNRRFVLTGFISVLLAACAAVTPVPTATFIPTVTFSPVPSSTPTLTLTPTAIPERVTLTVKDTLINCRYGPSVRYTLINELRQGESVQVTGRNDSFTWWYVRDPGNPNGYCWVSAGVTEIQGNVDQLAIIQSPVAAILSVNLRVDPNRIVVSCFQFPQTVFLEAEVTANGPTLAAWRWEVSTGESWSDTDLVFEEAGMQIINDYYQIDAPNEYSIKLHILTPNEWIEEVKFPVTCTP